MSVLRVVAAMLPGIAGGAASGCGFTSEGAGTNPTTTFATSTPDTGDTGSDTNVSTTASSADGTTGAGGPCGDWWNTDWSRRSVLRVKMPGAPVMLDDVPVLVVLTPQRFDYFSAAAGGADLRFVAQDGSQVYAHEVEHWEQGGTSYVWVRIPELPFGDDSWYFRLYSGNDAATSNADPAGVWSSGYRGVWHMKEFAGQLRNSAEDEAHIAPGDTIEEGMGVVGPARRFVNGSAQRAPLDAASAAYFDGWPAFTLSFWILPDYVEDSAWQIDPPDRFLSKGGGMRFGRTWREVGQLEGMGWVQVDFELVNAGGVFQRAEVPRAAWSLITYTYDGDTFSLYRDGVSVWSEPRPADSLIAGPDPIVLGDDLSALEGALDEVRIADVGRSPEWVEAQFRAMSDDLLAYGQPETCNP